MAGPEFKNIRVTIDGEQRTLTLEEFQALSLPKRVRLVISTDIAFFGEDGEQVDTVAALNALRAGKAK